METVLISFIKECRGPTLRPPCDVINAITIAMKYTFFLHNLGRSFTSEVKLKLCLIFQYFQNGHHFEVVTNFLTYVIPEVEYGSKICMRISDILRFWSTLKLGYWWRCSNFKIWPALWPGDVIDDVMSVWYITCTTRHRLLCTYEILFVWHQSFLAKSSGKHRDKHTNTGRKHYHLRYRGL